MKKLIPKRDAISVSILQAIICKREEIRPSPKEAAKLAVEHTDCLLEELGKQSRENLSYLEDWSKKKVLQ
jgi:hypothetical protein|tara:strand:+ start:389 stop:598 length:210 start_codon:yes stop_codon:yes gene_type:complete